MGKNRGSRGFLLILAFEDCALEDDTASGTAASNIAEGLGSFAVAPEDRGGATGWRSPRRAVRRDGSARRQRPALPASRSRCTGRPRIWLPLCVRVQHSACRAASGTPAAGETRAPHALFAASGQHARQHGAFRGAGIEQAERLKLRGGGSDMVVIRMPSISLSTSCAAPRRNNWAGRGEAVGLRLEESAWVTRSSA